MLVGGQTEGGDEDEGQYQRIADAISSRGGEAVMTQAMVHPTPASPSRSHPVYPHSDTEDSVFYPDTPSSGYVYYSHLCVFRSNSSR